MKLGGNGVKRRYVLIAGIMATALIASIAGTAAGDTIFKSLGRRMVVVQSVPDDVVARIGGEEISLRDIEIRRAVMTMNSEIAGQKTGVSRRDAMKALTRIKVEIAEARKRGLFPSDAEVEARYQSDQVAWDQAPKEVQARRNAAIAEYLSGSGLSRAEYDAIDRQNTAIEMAIVRLRSEVKGELPGDSPAEKEAAYQSFIQRLMDETKPELVNESLLD